MTDRHPTEYSLTPMVVGSILGYRAFSYGHTSGLLAGALRPTVWTDSQNTARCMSPNAHPGPPPAKTCKCGLYGMHNWMHVEEMTVLSSFSRWIRDKEGSDHFAEKHSFVYGVIEAWGRTYVGSRGFRAEHARILAVTPPMCQRRDGCKLSDPTLWRFERYPDLPIYSTMKEIAQAYPVEPVDHLLEA